MGIFDRIKEISDQVEQSAGIVENTNVAINTATERAIVGDTIQGDIVISCQQPLKIDSVKIKLVRRLSDRTLQDRDIWIFNSKDIPAQIQAQPNQPITVPFSFVAGEEMHLNGVVLSDTKQLFGGTNPLILPKKAHLFDYEHLISAHLNIDEVPIGPFGEKLIEFDYPNSGITITEQS